MSRLPFPNPMRIENVFFDMGNTLVHREIDRQVGFAILLRKWDYDISGQEMLDAYQNARKQVPHLTPYKQSVENLNRRLLAKIENTLHILGLSPAREIAEDLLKSQFNPIQPYENAVPVLRKLSKRGLKIGVISNWDPDLIGFCKTLGIHEFFDTIVASRALGFRKPDPEIFAAALASIDGRAHESVHIGDSVGSDAVGAMKMGIQPIIIDREGRYNQLFCPVIKGLEEIPSTLDSLES